MSWVETLYISWQLVVKYSQNTSKWKISRRPVCSARDAHGWMDGSLIKIFMCFCRSIHPKHRSLQLWGSQKIHHFFWQIYRWKTRWKTTTKTKTKPTGKVFGELILHSWIQSFDWCLFCFVFAPGEIWIILLIWLIVFVDPGQREGQTTKRKKPLGESFKNHSWSRVLHKTFGTFDLWSISFFNRLRTVLFPVRMQRKDRKKNELPLNDVPTWQSTGS